MLRWNSRVNFDNCFPLVVSSSTCSMEATTSSCLAVLVHCTAFDSRELIDLFFAGCTMMLEFVEAFERRFVVPIASSRVPALRRHAAGSIRHDFVEIFDQATFVSASMRPVLC